MTFADSRGLCWLLAFALCSLTAGCADTGVRELSKYEPIEPNSEGRDTVLDIKIENYEKLSREYPKEPLYKERLARLHWMKKDHKKALSYLEKARSLDPENPKYTYLQAKIYAGIGHYTLAEASYQELIQRTDGRFTGPYVSLAELCLMQERDLEATRILEQCIELDPTFPTPHYYLGRIALNRRDKDAAIDHLEQYLRLGGGAYQEEVLTLLEGLHRKVRVHHITG